MNDTITKLKWTLLIVGDIAILYLSLWLTLTIRYGSKFDPAVWQNHFVPFTILYAIWLLVFFIFGLYDPRLAKNNFTFFTSFLKALGAGAIIGVVYFYLTPFFGIEPRTNFILNLFLVFVLIAVWRRFYNKIIQYPVFIKNVVLITEDGNDNNLGPILRQHPQLGYQLTKVSSPDIQDLKVLRDSNGIHTIVIGVDLQKYPEAKRFLYNYFPYYQFFELPYFYEECTEKVPLSQIDEVWFLSNIRENDRRLYEYLKRAMDIFIGIILGIIFLLLLPFIALAIKMDSDGPVFYKQTRVGRNAEGFNVWKFRSMVKDAEKKEAQWAQSNDSRITRVGNILRKTYLDELPQVINVIKGNMSIVGPRPERPNFVGELQKEIPFYHVRHIIKPGLTGWAQIKYKYGNSKESTLEKLQYELYYLKHRSLFMDLKIILKTINKITRKGHL